MKMEREREKEQGVSITLLYIERIEIPCNIREITITYGKVQEKYYMYRDILLVSK